VGTKDNCQVAGSLSVATATASLPIAWRLYLPEEWANNPEWRQAADVPKQVQVQTKPQIALAQIRQAVGDGVAPGVVLADDVYGSSPRVPERSKRNGTEAGPRAGGTI
jgi:SRSO17 transposase